MQPYATALLRLFAKQIEARRQADRLGNADGRLAGAIAADGRGALAALVVFRVEMRAAAQCRLVKWRERDSTDYVLSFALSLNPGGALLAVFGWASGARWL